MPKFIYKAKSANGSQVAGMIEAIDARMATNKLREQKLSIVELNEKPETILEKIKNFGPFAPSVGAKELVIFSRQLSTMVSAGVPIVQSLGILQSQQENPVFADVLLQIKADIEGGMGIADAMKKHPVAFPDLYVAMVRAGELGGILDSILDRLSALLEKQEHLKGKVKSAMMYPLVMGAICMCITLGLLIFVVPTFGEIFHDFGAKLPAMTQVLLDLSQFLVKRFYLLPWPPLAVYYGVKKYYATPGGHEKMDAMFLKAPVFGLLLKKVAVAKFTRTMGTLIKAGVPILQALDTVAQTAGNVVVERAVLSVKDSIREGGRIADPLRKSGIFPSMVVQMISVGEETGSLDAMLTKIADFYDTEVDQAVDGLTSMLEPMVMVVMGSVLGTVIIALFMPMLSLGSVAGG